MKKKQKAKKTLYLKDETKTRTYIILSFTLAFFACLILRILYLNVFMGNYYSMKLNNEKDAFVYGESVARGRILDRNGKVLVDNKAIKSIYYKKPDNVTVEDEINIAYSISSILNLDYDKLTTRNQKEFYILINKEDADKLITEEEYELLENRKLTEDDIYELKIKRITTKALKTMDEEDKRAAYIYYLMNKGYYYEEKEIKIENVSDKEYAYFSENSQKLKGFNTKLEWERVYPYGDTLETILGSISSKETGLPAEETEEYLDKGYTLNDRVGISGLEKQYEELLKGEKAIYKVEDDNSLTLVKEGKKGTDIMLSIDIDLQRKIDSMLEVELKRAKNEANTEFFNTSYVVIQNPTTGEIMSISGKKIVKENGAYKTYDIPENAILTTVTPGSVVKGASIMVGYTTKVIDIGTVMEDACIKLYNLPEKCSWQTLGTINDLEALEWSSNVYQYKIAMKVGGFDYAYGKELKIDEKAFDIYRNMFYRFGLGVKTGIDYPKEEDGYKSTNRAGDLLINYSIGQYDTYTPLQLSQYVSTIANGGTRYKTRFLKAVLDSKGEVLYDIKPVALNKLNVEKKYINRVRQGFKMVMSSGTGIGYMDKAPSPAGKTGTSESFIDLDGDGVIDAESITNNFVGYAPSTNPVMSLTASFPDIQNPNSGDYKSYANQIIVSRATEIFFDLYNEKGIRIKKS